MERVFRMERVLFILSYLLIQLNEQTPPQIRVETKTLDNIFLSYYALVDRVPVPGLV